MPAHGYANLNGAAQRVGSAQKPSSRAYSGALPGLRSNAYVGRPGCMDRPRAALTRSATAERISRGVLERLDQRGRDDAKTTWRGEISSSRLRFGNSWNCQAKAGPESPVRVSRGPSGRRCGSHSATIVIGSENIHAGTGLSGIILEPDRDKAEAAAKEAIERLRRMPPSIRVERSAGAVGHNDAAGQAGS